MSEALKTIQAQIEALEKFRKEKNDFLSQVNTNITQLQNERDNVSKQLLEVSGAMQAYNESVRLINLDVTATTPVVVDTVAEVVPEPVTE